MEVMLTYSAKPICFVTYEWEGTAEIIEMLELDLIHQHALSGDFLGTKHTLRHVREGWQPRLVDRQNYDKWLESGGTSMRERAREKVEEILSAERERILPPDIEQRIRTIAERAVAAQEK
jgi:trimethylamine--corrinoid protein Co-methyltransferase